MKLFTLATIFCAASAFAADGVWDGQAASVSAGHKDTTIEVKDNAVVMTGKSGTGTYSYLIGNVKTAPFSLKGKSFSFTIEPTDSIKGDTVYIKGVAAGITKDKDGKNARKTVFSFVAYMPKAGTYVVTPGKDCPPFKWLAQQANWTTDDPIVKLELFQGRKEKDSPMGITFKDFKVVD